MILLGYDENLWEEGVVKCGAEVSVHNMFPLFTNSSSRSTTQPQHGRGVVARRERLENQ